MLAFSSLFLSTILFLLALTKCNAVIIDRVTCSNLRAISVQSAWNDMVAMAQVAYRRTVAARDGTSPPGEMRVVTNTFNTYFGVTNAVDGLPYRLSSVIGRRCFWMAAFSIYAADKLILGVLKDIATQDFNLNPPIRIFCDDTYLTESTTDQNGVQLPQGVYQAVSQ